MMVLEKFPFDVLRNGTCLFEMATILTVCLDVVLHPNVVTVGKHTLEVVGHA